MAAELEDLLTSRVTQRIPRATEAFAFARLSSDAHVLHTEEGFAKISGQYCYVPAIFTRQNGDNRVYGAWLMLM